MSNNTIITIDLEKELTEDELESFRLEAELAGADSLKEHFLNITIKQTEGIKAFYKII